MRIKKNDTVVVISGKERGKKGKVLRIDRESEGVTVEGLNLYRKHTRPKQQGEKGELVSIARPIRASKLALFCSTCGKGTRAGMRAGKGDARERFCKRCKASL